MDTNMRLVFFTAAFIFIFPSKFNAQHQLPPQEKIRVHVAVDEVDGRQPHLVSTTKIVDLGAEMRVKGLQPEGYEFIILNHENDNFMTVRLDRTTGIVLPPLYGYDRESLCGQQQLTKPCVDKYLIQAAGRTTNNQETVSFDLQITINNVNDHKPDFQSNKVIKKISEDSKTGTLVSLPKAIDKDSKDDVSRYYLEHSGESGQYFDIETKRHNGELLPFLRLIKVLDREHTAQFKFILVAKDAKELEAKLGIEVDVVDSNDNKPHWPSNTKRTIVVSECEYRRENSYIAQFDATDKDAGKFGNVAYELSEINSQQVLRSFYIMGNQLRLNKELDYENKLLDNPFTIEVIAKDGGGLTSSATYTINVTDCNDNSPKIVVHYVVRSVMENVASKVLVARVTVTDRDSGDNGRVDCHLDDNSKLQLEIDSNSDSQSQSLRLYKIWTKERATFDRELQETYAAHVVCNDFGENRRHNSAALTLKVEDQNDQAPKFEQRVFKFNVLEDMPAGSQIGAVMVASDADAGNNSQLTYSLDADGAKHFILSNSYRQQLGVQLSSKHMFDREQQANYTFQLVARDSGKPQLSTSVMVHVIIEDRNDNPPRFQHGGHYAFNITETACVGCSQRNVLVGQVHADDPDMGLSAVVTYKLGLNLNYERDSSINSNTYFRVESNTGKIFVNSALDREKHSMYQFEIVARDHGEPVQSSTTTVTINVLDLNDNRPEFQFPNSTSNTLYVDEAAVSGTALGFIHAEDPDAGKNGSQGLQYKLVSVSSKSSSNHFFQLDSRSGALTLVQRLDKYTRHHINLLVQAEDGGDPPHQSRLASLRVEIQRRTPDSIQTRGGESRKGGYPTDNFAPAQEDSPMQILIVLAAVVFVVFAVLLGVLVYMYARGHLDMSCLSCFGADPQLHKQQTAAVAVSAMSDMDTNAWTQGASIDSCVGRTMLSMSTPQTLRRNQSQETGYYEQDHFPDIIHFDDEMLREKRSNLGEPLEADAKKLNLHRTKSISFGYIPVACEDRYMCTSHPQPHHIESLKNARSPYQTIHHAAANAAVTFIDAEGSLRHSEHLPRKAFLKQLLVNNNSGGQEANESHQLQSVSDGRTNCLPEDMSMESYRANCTVQEVVHNSYDSSNGHAYTLLDANTSQKFRQPPPTTHIYDDTAATETVVAVSPANLTQVKTPYITSSFV